MNDTLKRTLAILLILAISIGAGFAIDAIWRWVEKTTHPLAYADTVSHYAEKYNIPKEIIFAVIKTESGFDPDAESPQGALGLMQMMPKTFEEMTGDEYLDEHLLFSSLKNPDISIRYGTYYLVYLAQYFDYNWTNVFAAYNGGMGNVSDWLKDPECLDEDGNLVNIPYPETADYVKRVENAIETYRRIYPEIAE